jgi:hypothetical protein
MGKLNKYKKHILMIGLLVVGICAVIFSNNVKVQGGLACLCLGLAILVAVWINKDKQLVELINFDSEADEILRDIAKFGEESEYYGYYNIDVFNSMRAQILKKQKKQMFSCVVFGIVLLIIAIICVI